MARVQNLRAAQNGVLSMVAMLELCQLYYLLGADAIQCLAVNSATMESVAAPPIFRTHRKRDAGEKDAAS